MVQNPQFLINLRKNLNANNPGYGKYYPKAVEKDTITLRGLAKHMAEHQCVYSRDIIEGVLIKMASCMIELIAQGNPVKIDGLGIFLKAQLTMTSPRAPSRISARWPPTAWRRRSTSLPRRPTPARRCTSRRLRRWRTGSPSNWLRILSSAAVSAGHKDRQHPSSRVLPVAVCNFLSIR